MSINILLFMDSLLDNRTIRLYTNKYRRYVRLHNKGGAAECGNGSDTLGHQRV